MIEETIRKAIQARKAFRKDHIFRREATIIELRPCRTFRVQDSDGLEFEISREHIIESHYTPAPDPLLTM